MSIYITGIDLSKTRSVLLRAPEYMSQADCFALKQTLEDEFPSVNFVIITGIDVITTSNTNNFYEIEAKDV